MENITYPVDLLRCNLLELKRRGKSQEIGENARMHPNATITRSIIGGNVIIREAVEIVDSLIFPNTTVEATGIIDRTILTPDSVIDCSQQLHGSGRVTEGTVGSHERVSQEQLIACTANTAS
jgi:NDP-sugar pyrophosphorylase family protein